MAEDTEDTILENALKPKRASGDTGSVEQFPIDDQLKARRAKQSKDAARRGMALRFTKLIPPGADGT